MAFGVYVHIPYCIQRCSYCDFATYEQTKIMPPEKYVDLVIAEIRAKAPSFSSQTLDTVYFGGGTPSLIPAPLILSILDELAKNGFVTGPQTEITLEINPATIDQKKMDLYLSRGINRFSVGAQSFDDSLLKMVGREHSSQQTLETLQFLKKLNLNYTFDLLFALPKQTLEGLKKDLEITMSFDPSHISAYCLTVPSGHPLTKGRPPEEEQLEMFDLIRDTLLKAGHRRYEISNFAKPGFESRHNLLYWEDQEYWSLGLSAHSYTKSNSNWGVRYWNAPNIGVYEEQIEKIRGRNLKKAFEGLPLEQFEVLEQHQALTDFCHTALRIQKGLKIEDVRRRFSRQSEVVKSRLDSLINEGLLTFKNDAFSLSEEGLLVSNLVFEKMAFLKEEILS
ncbi:MAG: radical SAM family heme chaperone HemW [Pseudobdellovibrionaceae bacterium]